MINILSPLLISCSVLTLLIGVLLYIIYNLYRKNTIYENWTNQIFEKINKLQSDMKQIDDKNIFETDDEVGAVFEDLAKIIQDFDHDITPKEKEL
tara:strand:+ start:1153 stop:1437 length:285 start_codon:yes stop_codon:yes gene_type:complete